MSYVLLICAEEKEWEALTPEVAAAMAEYGAYGGEVKRAGKWVAGDPPAAHHGVIEVRTIRSMRADAG